MSAAGRSPKRSLRFETAHALLHAVGQRTTGCCLQKVPDAAQTEIWRSDPCCAMRWLVGEQSGVYLVILESQLGCVHTVAVDARPLRRIIVDTLEPYAMRLSVRALMLCGGGEGVRVRAMRKVVTTE